MNNSELDRLKEIFNIGAGEASKALSNLTDKKVDVEFPEIKEMNISDIPQELGDRSKIYATVLVNVEVVEEDSSKDRLGKLILMLKKDSAMRFADYLESEVYETGESRKGELTEHDESALKETGNILTGACLAAMTSWVDLELKEGIPEVETDMLGATLDHILVEMSMDVEEALYFQTDFSFEEEISANFLFLFENEGEEEILEKLEV